MNHFLTVLLLFVSSGLFAQLTDDFTDLDFTNNPTWSGTDANFIVNASTQVQLNASAAGTSYLSTAHNLTTLDDQEWRFWTRINAAPSASNFGRIYLTSTSADLTTNPDGFYLQLGEALATDAVRLMKSVGGISTQICASPDGTIAAAFINNIKVNRDNAGLWTLSIDAVGGENFTQVGTGTDATNLLGTHTGYICTYTVGNINRYYFDNVYVGDEIVDLIPPTVVSVTAVNANLIDVLFNEPVDPSTAQDVNNYNIQPFQSATSATIDGTNPALVHLIPMSPLINGSTYDIFTSGIEDLANNASVLEQNQFSYYIAETPVAGDVIINEFMCDESPVVGLPEVEFVEIYNRSSKVFNLQNWKLGDNATFGNIANSTWLLPGEYKILCSTTALIHYANGAGVTSFPSLNNSGDDIVLQDNTGLNIDKITYDISWYNDTDKDDGGYTIERKNPNAPCSGSNNWAASTNVNGGTPGTINSVNDLTPDTQAPELQNVFVTATNTIQLIFNESMDSTSLAVSSIPTNPILTEQNRSIAGGFPIEMTLEYQEDFQLSQLYTITFNNVADCSGNTTSLVAQFQLPDDPLPGDVIISEFMCDQAPVVGLPEVEFVEIYNRSNKLFNIQGWKLGDNATFGTVQTGFLQPGEHLILCASSSLTDYPNGIGVTSFPSLNNSSDDIILTDVNGVVLDKISYTSEWYHDDSRDDGGYSIERINPNAPCSGIDNWRASVDPNGGTPAAVNSVIDLTPDTEAPFIVQTFAPNSNNIEIFFSEGMDSTSLANAVLTVQPNLTEQNRVVSGTYPESMQVQFLETLQPSQFYTYILQPLNDCSMNTANGSAEFALADLAAFGDVVINEIMFNPLTGGSDWVELYNKSDKLLNLKDWSFGNFDDDTISNIKMVTNNYLLKPKDFVVVGANPEFVLQNYPATIPDKDLIITLPSLNTDSSTLFVMAPSFPGNILMDKLSYSDDWHFRLMDDDKGKSLERMNPDAITQDQNNWHTAAEAIGFATPGGENSQYYPAISSGTVSFTSETFSPDNDGFEDVLQINYELELAGLVGTMKIYDDRGRKIKDLMSSELLAISGMITWDGVNDDGAKASIGTYVLVFEAFQVNGGTEFVSKKAFVLAAKL